MNETNIYTCVYKSEEKLKKNTFVIADDGQRTLWGHWLFLITEIPHLIYQWELLLIFHLGHKLLSFLRWGMLRFVYDFLGNWNWTTCRCNSLLYNLSWLKLNFMCCTTRNFVTKNMYSLILCLYFVIFIKDSILFLILQINNIFFLYPVQCTCSLRIYYVFRIRTSNICENGWHWQRQHFFEPCTFCTVGMQWLWWW